MKVINNGFLVDEILSRGHTSCFDSEKQQLDRSQTLPANAWRGLGLHQEKRKLSRYQALAQSLHGPSQMTHSPASSCVCACM